MPQIMYATIILIVLFLILYFLRILIIVSQHVKYNKVISNSEQIYTNSIA